MNKPQLIDCIAKEGNISKVEAKKALELTIGAISEAMAKGKTLDNMSFDEALKFANNGNFKDFIDHYNNLPNRPDWDGYLTLKEANE